MQNNKSNKTIQKLKVKQNEYYKKRKMYRRMHKWKKQKKLNVKST